MKFRESGMPDEQLWNTFFEPDTILKELGVNRSIRTLIDIGCGYGTFLIPAARLIGGKAVGIDVDKEILDICKKNLRKHAVDNIELIHGDFMEQSAFNNYADEIDYICLFNILHCEEPVELLKIAHRMLSDHGKLGVIHWKYEQTPRGPSMEIRPKPENIIEWAEKAGFLFKKQVELLPYHFGLVFAK